MFKIDFYGDIHLLDREIGATIGYREESSRNLKKIRNSFLDNGACLAILGGDIQHAKPDDIREMSKWRALLRELKTSVEQKAIESGILDKMKVYDAEGKELKPIEEVSILFSLKGNHDYNKRQTKEKSFTFFDDLVEAEIISVPKVIVIDKVQINLYSSEECMKPIPRKEGIETVIGVYHDPIVQDGRLMDKYMGKMISPGDHKFFNDVDLAILNDIHLPIEPYKVTTVGEDGVGYETIVITHGSIGRTSFSDSHKRDYANFTQVLVKDSGDIEYELKEMDLLPYKELFDYQQVIKVKKRENMFEEFTLEIEKVDKVKGDPRDEIREMDIDDDVKEVCLGLLEDIMEGSK